MPPTINSFLVLSRVLSRVLCERQESVNGFAETLAKTLARTLAVTGTTNQAKAKSSTSSTHTGLGQFDELVSERKAVVSLSVILVYL